MQQMWLNTDMTLLSLFKKKPKIIVICGPTATGKTSLAIDLAQQFDGEIISADSRQVYQGLDIGSAKVTKEEMRNIPHHMIDVADPRNRYSVAEYKEEAQKIIDEIISNKKLPIICGGTGMYIDALVFNHSFPEVPENKPLRAKLETKSTEELFTLLLSRDSRRAKSIDKHNKVRLIRALEIIEALGKVPQQKTHSPYSPLFIGLDVENDLLHTRIKERILERLNNQSMLEEAKTLHYQGVSWQRMEELGLEYRYMARHLQGDISFQDMVKQLSIATRQFAKRQRTWFKRNRNIHWFNPLIDKNNIRKLVTQFIKK